MNLVVTVLALNFYWQRMDLTPKALGYSNEFAIAAELEIKSSIDWGAELCL